MIINIKIIITLVLHHELCDPDVVQIAASVARGEIDEVVA